MASDRPLHEVVAALDGVVAAKSWDYEGPDGPDIQAELAAVLKAADALRHEHRFSTGGTPCVDRYDAAVADLRRALEGK